jgi:acetyltransferase-like isoleucine patch superfamily enzyme
LRLRESKRTAQRAVAGVAAFLDRQRRFDRTNDLLERGLLVVGRHTYGVPSVRIYRGSESNVVIGKFCSISPDVEIIVGGIHPADWVSTYPFRARWGLPRAYQDGMPVTKGDVRIGCDVWIGTGAMILSGVEIGHGAIVAARSVVTRDVRPYSIVAGVPAREIALRHSEENIVELLRIAWWDWDDDEILAAVPLLSSPDASSFVARYRDRSGA